MEDLLIRMVLAKKTGRSKSFYIREAIVEHLEQLEDTYLALLSLEKPTKRWTLNELWQL